MAELGRRDISAQAKVLLATRKMESLGKDIVALSTYALAESSGLSRTHIRDYDKELERAGLIEKHGNPKDFNGVQAYKILGQSPSEKPATQELQVVLRTKNKRAVRLQPCSKCAKPCVKSIANGFCRKCEKDANLSRRIRGEVNKAIRNGVSHEEMVEQVKKSVSSPSVRSVESLETRELAG